MHVCSRWRRQAQNMCRYDSVVTVYATVLLALPCMSVTEPLGSNCADANDWLFCARIPRESQ
jgi:hypothetical protein